MNTLAQKALKRSPLPLNKKNLGEISNYVPALEYNPQDLECGIVHMSVGGFHRSHQAVYLDKLLGLFPDNWMICGIGLLPSDKENIETLNNQDNLYTVLERSAKEDKAKIIGSMKEAIHAPSNPELVLQKMARPETKILSLTITEKGYCYDKSGNLDQKNAHIQADLKSLNRPTTALGYVVSALGMRKQNNIAPFTVMSCDNLPGNGDLTRKLVLQFAELVDKDLAQWISDEVCFPNAMVDRITPVTTQDTIDLARDKFFIDDKWPVVCEDYIQWVLEDKFNNGRPPLEEVGVQLVEDVEPYEKMKVRLLNGSHSALSYISYLMGYREVDKAMADPLISKFVRLYMDQDITPCVPDVPGVNLDEYKDKLIERFANPAISDQVQRLAEDGSQKIPNAILPCISYQLEHGGSIKYASLALAAWFYYLIGVDEDLKPIEIKDPLADKLSSRMKVDPRDPTHILGLTEVFGTELPISPEFIKEIKAALDSLHEKGARKTLEAYLT